MPDPEGLPPIPLDDPLRGADAWRPALEPAYARSLDRPADRPRNRPWRHIVLFLATIASTTAVGALQYADFLADFRPVPLQMSFGLLVHGLWYSATILAILGCHEMGHYLACRYYRVDASLPYFLPAPVMTGTLGAFIRIREQIPSKRTLFDIGVAGPLAGFVVAVPALFIGIALSHQVTLPHDFSGLSLGEPLLYKIAERVIWGHVPDGLAINLHPMAFAAWFGLLATALNLFPIGQLDGGHISYAVLGRRSTWVTFGAVGCALVLTYFSLSWLVWTGLIIVMLYAFGPHHPRTLDEHVPLDRVRLAIAFLALVIFVLCFTPTPIEPMDLLGRR